ncbi:hypothetical protein LXM60_06640 [Pandoraea sputorum]|uniref:hypothetical protein n=1 Tax=Pandoraea sputorum TaxID=93222 RepID=UPI001E53F32B|nr:hypothetical protein [Pandoraea sputorum]MCE4059884.1 hypothetical protein [Pandoraea sputorum]
MTAGLQVFDENQNVFWDSSIFAGRSLGSILIGGGAGSVVNEAFATGIPWAIPVMESKSPIYPYVEAPIDVNLWLSAPTYYFAGNTMHWSRTGAFPTGWTFPSCILYYGVR